jgi:predicted porin
MGGVHARSALRVYGIIDDAVGRSSNGNGSSRYEVVSGQGSASRLGFRGVEDLSGGLRAIFNNGAAFNLDNGLNGSTPFCLAFGVRHRF